MFLFLNSHIFTVGLSVITCIFNGQILCPEPKIFVHDHEIGV